MPADNDALRLEFLGLRDSLVTDFQADGLIFAEDAVMLVYTTVTGANQNTGARGQETVSRRIPVDPRPTVDLTRQTTWENGAQVVIGDAKVIMSRAYSEADILLAAWLEIEGVRYSLAASSVTQSDRGQLRRAKGGLDWEIYLNLMDQREDLAP